MITGHDIALMGQAGRLHNIIVSSSYVRLEFDKESFTFKRKHTVEVELPADFHTEENPPKIDLRINKGNWGVTMTFRSGKIGCVIFKENK